MVRDREGIKFARAKYICPYCEGGLDIEIPTDLDRRMEREFAKLFDSVED